MHRIREQGSPGYDMKIEGLTGICMILEHRFSELLEAPATTKSPWTETGSQTKHRFMTRRLRLTK